MMRIEETENNGQRAGIVGSGFFLHRSKNERTLPRSLDYASSLGLRSAR